VCELISAAPGQTARQIANQTGIDKRSLNQFLYYEGKSIRGLYVRNWRWYHSGAIQIPLPSFTEEPTTSLTTKRNAEPSPPPTTICEVLLTITEINAIREIKRMDRLAVEKAFSEEHYPSLPDVLQIELIQRLHELNKNLQTPQNPKTQSPILIPLIIVGSIAILIKIISTFSK
jgi:hypothetical protein